MNEVVFLIVVLSAYILPIVIVLNSKRSKGHEKNGWLMGIIIFSWLGLMMYFAIVPKHGHKKKKAK
ncbi:PLDc N-terminal domain-containing protein [Pseudoalteromonas sp. TAE56]|uniref:PLDc N-terminal domain-containing protein n=1 Tax=Pseudoalteromonas sp. TAE56 TaxID=1938596 RepID=UPI0003FE6F23|nr:PLDc N-terminal domain-containing protein [Pseudoalteromonas sp. TAE56]